MSQSITVRSLNSNSFEALEVRTVRDALDRPNITMLRKAVDPLMIEVFLAAQITKIIKQINIDPRLNIHDSQVPMIVDMLLEKYPVESLEDISLCLRRGAIGYYGSIYRVDAAVINEWMSQYLEEKYQIVESQIKKEKNAFDEIAERAPEILTELRSKLNKQFVPGDINIVLENKKIPRPEWIIGETCPHCKGLGYLDVVNEFDVPYGSGQCPTCKGIGEINLMKVHAETEELARKAYEATFKKSLGS